MRIAVLIGAVIVCLLFIATQSAGRSAAMGAALVISFVMLRSHPGYCFNVLHLEREGSEKEGRVHIP